jgi:succinate dehydrogenase/fumarate reductase flavoprotein subunit
MAHVAHGASPFLLGCNAPLGTDPDEDSADAHFNDVVEAGGHLNDPRLVRALASHAVADALVFGALAGKGAAISAMSLRERRAPRHALNEGAAVRGSLVRGLGRTDFQEILGIIQRTMSQNVGLRRHRDGLAAAASLLSDLERSLESEESPADVTIPAFFAGLSARMIIQAALLRTESCGAHQRTDFPLQDDAYWLRHIAFRAGPTGDLQAETIPVD